MTTTIAGHKLTKQQLFALDVVRNFMRHYGSDSALSATSLDTSPAGDGRWVALTEIFPARDNYHNGLRRIIRRLARYGVLRACEIDFQGDSLKSVPL